MSPKLRTLLFLVPTIVVADQASKAWVVRNISPLEPREVIEGFFRLTHARNPGAALGLFQDLPWWVFVGLTFVALGLILHYLSQVRPEDRLSSTALALIMGGAIGNLIDRAINHEVVDFLQFDFGLFIFPDFNVADSAIVVGVGLLLLDVVIHDSEDSAGPSPSSEPGSEGLADGAGRGPSSEE